jgi:hypothetical protein
MMHRMFYLTTGRPFHSRSRSDMPWQPNIYVLVSAVEFITG